MKQIFLLILLILCLSSCEEPYIEEENAYLLSELIAGDDQNGYFLEPTDVPIIIEVGDSIEKVVFSILEGGGDVFTSLYYGPGIGRIENEWLLGCEVINSVQVLFYSADDLLIDTMIINAVAGPMEVWNHSCGLDFWKYQICEGSGICPFAFSGISSVASNSFGHIFIVQSNIMKVSYNYGKDFEIYNHPDLEEYSSSGIIFATNKGKIYAHNYPEKYLLVSDSSQTKWNVYSHEEDFYFSNFKLFQEDYIITNDNYNKNYFSNNSGKTWKEFYIQFHPATFSLINDFIVFEGVIYAVDDDGYLIKSLNWGDSWEIVMENILNPETNKYEYFQDIHFHDGSIYLETQKSLKNKISLYRSSNHSDWDLFIILEENEIVEYTIKDFSINHADFYTYKYCGTDCGLILNRINSDGTKTPITIDFPFTSNLTDYRLIDDEKMFFIGNNNGGGYVNF